VWYSVVVSVQVEEVYNLRNSGRKYELQRSSVERCRLREEGVVRCCVVVLPSGLD
jgi:hypothetical protein